MIAAKVIADSVSPAGDRITTLLVDFHRFILAEVNTHRVFTRNSASSRAIPVSVTLAAVTDDPAFPIRFPAEQPGMQGGDLLTGDDLQHALELIEQIHAHTTQAIRQYIARHPDSGRRLHKSVLNRYLEPFMWHRAVITATDWDGFFALRCNPAAQPEMEALANKMRTALDRSTPTVLQPGEWHLPFIDDEDRADVAGVEHPDTALQIRSVARCARVSYRKEHLRDPGRDLDLYAKLRNNGHASPFEHVATPVDDPTVDPAGNFTGWHQLRHILGLDERILRLAEQGALR